MLKKAATLIFITLLLFGCGGSDGGAGGLPPERPIAHTGGYAVDAVIEGGTVTAYSWTDGIRGDSLGSAVTDEDGYYEISVQAEAQPILLELTGGSYIEEASGKRVSLKAEQKLYAAINYGGSDISVMITPYTTLAAGLAQYYINEQGYNVENAITVAQSEITGITVFNILNEYPVNITLPENQTDELTDGIMYGFFCAALSSWTAEISEQNGTSAHDVYNSIYLTQIMYQDVLYDGVLNGYGITGTGRAGNLMAGTVALDSQAYRLKIGHHIIIAAGAEYNRTGLNVEDVLTQAEMFSQRVNGLFGHVDPLPLDTEGPRVYRTEPIGQQYRGTTDFGFRIEDPVGISTMHVSIDGETLDAEIAENSTGEDITVTINTGDYVDGDHILEVVASDLLGNVSTNQQQLIVNNTGILLNVNELPTITRVGSIEVAGTYETTGTLIESITVNGNAATIQQVSQTWSSSFTLLNGPNVINIVATDSIGNETTVTRNVDCDRVSPEIVTGDNHSYHRFYIGGGDVMSLILHDENAGHPLYFTFETTSLNGVEVDKQELFAAEIPFFMFTLNDPSDNGVSTQSENLTVTMTYSRPGAEATNRTLFPIDGSTDEYIIPLVTEYLDANFYQAEEGDIHTITVRVVDQAGNSAAKILSFKTHISAGELAVNSLNSSSTVTVFAYDEGTKGGIIAATRTNSDGTATVKMFTEPRPILIELTEGRYKETGSGSSSSLEGDQRLCAVANFEGDDLSVSVTPLTTVAAALLPNFKGSYPTTQEAVYAANDKLSRTYGVDIIGSGIVDINDTNNATGICTDEYRHSFILAGLSAWTMSAAEQNGAYSQDFYNSVLLSELMAADISNDSMLSGGQSFGAVPINSSVYQNGFGNAIVAVINSSRNLTQLDVNDFTAANIEVADAAEEPNALGVAFSERATTLNKDILSTEYTIINTTNKGLLVDINAAGSNNLTHTYFDAVRVHLIQENTQYDYRASNNYVYNPVINWVAINEYRKYENHEWHTVDLPDLVQTPIEYDSDILPGATEENYHYFITDTQSDDETYYMCNTCQSGPMGIINRDEIIANYAIPIDGSYNLNCRGNFAYTYAPLVQSGNIPCHLPGFEIPDGEITPQIQRKYSTTYQTIDGPRDETTATYSIDNSFASYVVVENGSGGAPSTESGYYIIPPGGQLVIKKRINTPNISTYSDGEITYTSTTFDQSFVFDIDKSLNLNIIIGNDPELVAQMPVYALAQTGSRTYSITR